MMQLEVWEPRQEQAGKACRLTSICAVFGHIIAAWLEVTSLTHLSPIPSFSCYANLTAWFRKYFTFEETPTY